MNTIFTVYKKGHGATFWMECEIYLFCCAIWSVIFRACIFLLRCLVCLPVWSGAVS